MKSKCYANSLFIAFSTIVMISLPLTWTTASAAGVQFTAPKDGDTIPSNFVFKFEVTEKGWKTEPAGKVKPKSGHHHIIVNGESTPQGKVIPPNDATHYHFGKGQTEATLNLKPGTYALTLQFADGAHASYGPNMSQTIHVTVAP